MKLLLIILLFISNNTFGEYKNTNGKAIEKPFKDLVKWMTSGVNPKLYAIEVSNEWKNINLHEDDNYIIWIGHSTFLIKKSGIVILTDPVFSDRASPFKNIGPKRLIPPAIPLNKLPKINFVTVSHNHYDHLDEYSIRQISKHQPNVKFLVPLGLRRLLIEWGVADVIELDWWQSVIVKGVTFQPTPVQHWSKRSAFDRNKTLWAGWMTQWEDFSFYFTGDTGYSDDFKEVSKRLGRPDLAAIPIGAYEPRAFMKSSHINPEEAVAVFKDLGARYAIAIHWGTFKLTLEKMDEPPRRLERAIESAEVSKTQFRVLQHGEFWPEVFSNS